MLGVSYHRGSSCVSYVELQPDASCMTMRPPNSKSDDAMPNMSTAYVDKTRCACFNHDTPMLLFE